MIEVLPWGSRVTLSCGAVVEGAPQGTEAQRETARSLGYGDDDLAMVCDHDPLHALLCGWLGIGDSLSLLCASGLREEDEASRAEEAAVMAVQRFMRLSGGRLSL